MNQLIKIFTALLLVVFCNTNVFAQSKPINVQVKVVRPNSDDPTGNSVIDFIGCEVHVFKKMSDARMFYNSQKQLAADDIVNTTNLNIPQSVEMVKTDASGECELQAIGSNWYVVAFQYPYLSPVIPVDNNFNLHIETVSLEKMLQEVVKKEKRKRQKTKSRNLSIGDMKILKADVYILPQDRNSNLRYGVSPYATVIGNNSFGFTSKYRSKTLQSDSLFKNIRPYVIDGENFNKTQHRKMGYDSKNNDPLYQYIDTLQKVKSHDEDNDTLGFHIFEVLRPTRPDALYPSYGYLWNENMGYLEVTDTILIDAGYSIAPMRFIDFAFPNVEIDKARYHTPARREAQEGKAELHIEFVNGKAEVLPTDSVGLEQLENIIKALENIFYDPDGRLYSVKVHGYASPEGGRAVNERLCRQRADYIKNKTVSRFAGTDSYVEGSVATWQDVADLLRADSLADPENLQRALQMEEVIASSNPAQLDSRIASLPFYKFLKENEDKYYKPLRKVEISYEFSMARILTKDEVIDRYKNKQIISLPYQYEFLFDYLKDRPKELEVIAKKALALGGKIKTLAAYHISKCYLARDTCDLTLLAPYISLDDYKYVKNVPFSRVERTCSTLLNGKHVTQDGDLIQWINDEAIVLQQISMCVKSNKILEAFSLSDNLLPEEDTIYSQPKKLLECMQGNWNIKEVREAVAKSSAWNSVIVKMAQDGDPEMDDAYWQEAWDELNDTTKFHMESPRELYVKATLAKRLYSSAKNWTSRKDEVPIPKKYFGNESYTPLDHPSLSDDAYPWGAPMIKACEMEPGFINALKFDGEFTQNYRDGFAEYWNEKHPDKILK